MKTMVLNLPDDLDIDTQEMTVFLAAKLYEDGKLSLGKAAKMAGVDTWDFPEVLSRYGVPLVSYPVEELNDDVRNAHRFSRNANGSR